MSFNWFSIGVNIIQQIISGFTSIKLPAVTPPTTIPREPGERTGTAIGTHGWHTVPPGFEGDNYPVTMQSGEKFMVIPRGGQISSAMMGESVNASQQIINNMQLTINSSAQTENLVADYEMMKSLIGA